MTMTAREKRLILPPADLAVPTPAAIPQHPLQRLPFDRRRYIQKWGQVKCCCARPPGANCDCIGTVPDEIVLTISGLTDGYCTYCSNFNGVFTLQRNYDKASNPYFDSPCGWYYFFGDLICGCDAIGVEVWPALVGYPDICMPYCGLAVPGWNILNSRTNGAYYPFFSGPGYPATLDNLSLTPGGDFEAGCKNATASAVITYP